MMRITITDEEFTKLLELTRDTELHNRLLEEQNKSLKSITTKKIESANRASEAKVERAKQQVIDAVEQMIQNNEKINISTVAKHSKLAYNTVKKYKYLITNRI